MTIYKHTQVGYLMLAVTAAVLVLFAYLHMTAFSEPLSVDSGPNVVMTCLMVLIVCILASFSWLTVTVDKEYLGIKFGYGIFRKKFLLKEIATATSVRNHWYYGWGIRVCPRPYMWIYNVSGLDAVEIVMNNGKVYRIGTDAPKELVAAIKRNMRA